MKIWLGFVVEQTASFPAIYAKTKANPNVDLISDADKALYQAKENGRNQVVLRANMANCTEAV